jgi:light-regulated signal transduction histidine kinase (bacteriophytochrome)
LPEITADPITLSEIFSNLISNALKYNEKPEKWVEIGYTETPEEPTVFYVRDNGIGIEPEHLDSIFVIFRRLHGPKEYGGGTGAGLTIARKLAERHGGRMWVESLVDQGSTFYFTL